ncbi:MAG: hypothetical protein D6709_02975 [Chloroflexi bacterium]|jgi:hypothetical protein|uniref:Uncharacterized protein n=1 Tax=Candidatus Thermofonsia Clade 3 bacterium TaxID=2364212 RepID=A0A2M8QDU9_9CHLR|nr:hypothetical protein [Candidatus Roseilinea sp. NK_OTU-006]PJF47983.1 MAG: hypothetical protein CUN48_05925 [Candidatus Thermofonsia Clade 3 bacterium]RMG65290.1 MAG: hypothetical protein D6709_02975 [Chloroflexota bacterium]
MTDSLHYALVGAGAGIAVGGPFFTGPVEMVEATRPDVVIVCVLHPYISLGLDEDLSARDRTQPR